MYTNDSIVRHQQHQVSRHSNDLDAMDFFNQLTSTHLFDRVESLLPEHRERLFPPTQTLSLFLSQAVSEFITDLISLSQLDPELYLPPFPQSSTLQHSYSPMA